jgi:SAM-dependent methyltransferase
MTPHPTGLARSLRLVRLYRREPAEPAPFYDFLAHDTVAQLRPHGARLDGRVIDVGGGPGYLADVVREQGGTCFVVDAAVRELRLHGRAPTLAAIADGRRLPVLTAAMDVAHSSNVLEHVRQPHRLLAELVRVLRPGGIGYLSFTPWLSPWGGHETSPWHYLGGNRAAERYERRTGHPPKNRYGVNLHRLRLAPVRAWFAANPDVDVLWQGPRYWPASWRHLVGSGAVSEALTWNHLVIFRRSVDAR